MGLVVWLPLNGNLNNQGTGSNFAFAGTPAYKNGKMGKCLDLTNSTYLDGTCPDLNGKTAFSICCWIYGIYNSNNSEWANAISFGTSLNGTTSTDFRFGRHNLNDSSGYAASVYNNNSYTIMAANQAGSVPFGVWNHICFTTDGSTWRFYVNGAQNSYNTGKGGSLTGRIIFRPEAYDGGMNDLRIYDHVLSPKEVKEISKGLTVHYPLSAGGQNNLLTRTMKMEDWPFATARTSRTAGVGDFNQMVLVGSTADWNASCSCLTTRYHLVRGKQVTFSYYAKATASCSFCIDWTLCRYSNTQARYKYRDEYFTIGTEWKRYTVTRTIEDSFFTSTDSSDTNAIAPNADYFGIRFYLHTDNVTMYTYGWKLEYGSVATPWRPHPADPQYMAIGLFTGNRNLLVDSRKNQGKSLSTYDIGDYNLSESFVAGKTYTISARGNWSSDKKSYAFFLSGGSGGLVHWPTCCADGYMVGSFTATSDHASNTAGAGHGFIRVYISNNIGSYQGSTALSGTANVDWIKVEEGDIATGWTPNQNDSDYANQMIEYDVSGFGYNAIREGAIGCSSDTPKYTTSSVFYGAGAINCGKAFNAEYGKNITFSCWAKCDDWTLNHMKYFISSQEDGGLLLCTHTGNGTIYGRVRAYNASDLSSHAYFTASTTNHKTLNGWHMFACTFDNDAHFVKLYLDGELIAANTDLVTTYGLHFNPNANMYLGAESSGLTYSGTLLAGKMSDVRLYYTTLTDAEILELYNTSAAIANNGTILANEFVE